MTLPLFPVTSVGSWPRPDALLAAMKRRRPDAAKLMDEATVAAIRAQEAAGVDLVTDGEQRRDNFYSFLCEKLDGLRLMTMADLLDHVEDKAGFEALLQTLDVPAFAIRDPTVVGKLRLKAPLVAESHAIPYRCTIHPWMNGWVRVFDHPYYAVTDEDGKFEIKNAPAGKFRIVFWHENGVKGGAKGRFGEPIEIKGPTMEMKPTDFDVSPKG